MTAHHASDDIGTIGAGTLVGDYELLALVGSGGMGAVFRARHRRTGEIAAVKVFGPRTIEAAALARFYQEARIHQSLAHPHIARFIELVNAGGRPALAIEFVAGESVAETLAVRGRFDPAAALRVTADVARAAAHAHARGVVHRDIKPANVRMTADGVTKLLDFGIAKAPSGASGLTTPGNVIGTPCYLAPEQLLGEPATPASDAWAIGVLLYEMTTGRVPFAGDGPVELWRSIGGGRYLPPSALAASGADTLLAPLAAIDDLVARCLVADAARRASAHEIAAAADAAIGRSRGEAARAARPSGSTERRGLAALDAVRRRAGARVPIAAQIVVVIAAFVALIAVGRFISRDASGGGQATVHHIDVTSGHAAVTINGRRAGRTPLDYRGRVGEVIDVDLEMPGYVTAHEQIQLGVEGTSTFTLQPATRNGGRP